MLKMILTCLTILSLLLFHHPSVARAQGFNLTAISAKYNASRLECWQLSAPPFGGRAAANFPLGSVEGEAIVGIIPPNTRAGNGTLGNAPIVQYSLIIAGLVHIRTPLSGLPASQNEAYIAGGRGGWLIAADTANIAAQGHVTDFPGNESTVIAQFPIKGNVPPEHTVLHDGPCVAGETTGT